MLKGEKWITLSEYSENINIKTLYSKNTMK